MSMVVAVELARRRLLPAATSGKRAQRNQPARLRQKNVDSDPQ